MDEREKLDLFEKNTRFAYWCVQRYFPTLSGDEDVVQEALIGLWKACCNYDPGRGAFPTIAYHCIKNQILMLIRRRKSWTPGLTVSLDDPIPDNPDLSYGDMLGSLENDPCGTDRFLIEYLDSIPEKNKTVLFLAAKGFTQKEIGEKVGLSKSYCSRILTKYRKLLTGAQQ